MKVLYPEIKTLQRIFHVADIHIRNLQRHKEYEKVFDSLYQSLEEQKIEGESLIIVAGDVVHSKTDMSPELFVVARRFLENLAEICPVLLVPGNHDELENNPDRLDALTPIVKDAKGEIKYVRESCLIKVGNTVFSHMYFGDKPEDWTQAHEIENRFDEKIAIYHDVVDKSETDHGFVLESERMRVPFFTGFDKVILGDIHKRQRLQASTVQQLQVPDHEVQDYEAAGWRAA